MKQDRDGRMVIETFRALNKREIDLCMQHVVAEVAGGPAAGQAAERVAEPRWISAAELVRRVRRFVVYN